MLLFLLGCRCPAFSDMEIVDQTGEADEAFLADVRRGIADFAAWSGGAGVCIPGVEVVEEIEGHEESVVGLYQDQGEPILLERQGETLTEPPCTSSVTRKTRCSGMSPPDAPLCG